MPPLKSCIQFSHMLQSRAFSKGSYHHWSYQRTTIQNPSPFSPPLSHAPWQIKVIGIRSSKPTDAQIFIPHRCSNFWRDNVTTCKGMEVFSKGEGCFSKATSHHLKHNNPGESVVIVLLPSCWVSLQADRIGMPGCSSCISSNCFQKDILGATSIHGEQDAYSPSSTRCFLVGFYIREPPLVVTRLPGVKGKLMMDQMVATLDLFEVVEVATTSWINMSIFIL